MRSLFKKVTNRFNPEICALEEFIQHYELHTLGSEKEIHHIPHLPIQKEAKQHRVITYKITQEECKNLQANLPAEATLTPGESKESYFGKILHKGQQIGFYFGQSYQYNTYWARFWLE
jgi:hypothetical protein